MPVGIIVVTSEERISLSIYFKCVKSDEKINKYFITIVAFVMAVHTDEKKQYFGG